MAETAGKTMNKGPSHPVGFKNLVNETLAIFRKKIWLLFGISLGEIALTFMVNVFFIPILSYAKIAGKLGFLFPFLFSVLVGFISYLFWGVISNQVYAAYTEKKVNLKDSFKIVAKAFGKAIHLFLRIFFYSGFWILILVLILFPLLNNIFTFNPGFGGLDRSMILTIINLTLSFIGFFSVIFFIFRYIQIIFAYTYLMANPLIKPKEALSKSVSASKNRWWLIASYYLIFNVILLLPYLIVYTLVKETENNLLIQIIGSCLLIIFSLLVFPFKVTFLQVFAQELDRKDKNYGLNKAFLALAIFIVFFPLFFFLSRPNLSIEILRYFSNS